MHSTLKYFGLTFFLVIEFSVKVFSQTADFNLKMPAQKMEGCYYNRISFIDSRYDTTNMGSIHVEQFSNKLPVVVKTSFHSQFKKLGEESTDSSAKNGEMVFQLRKLKFAEKDEPGNETGYCFLRANLYSKENNDYKKLAAIDTLIIIPYNESSKSLMEEAAKVISAFIAPNLMNDVSDRTGVSYTEVLHVDSVEKRKLKVYNLGAFENGAYRTYQSFKNQVPDHKIAELVFRTDGGVKMKIESKTGKKEKMSAEDLYAFVHEGKAYIAAEYGCYLLEKNNDEFFFIGKGTVPGSDEKKQFKIRIDHVDGRFMRVAEVK